MRRLTTAVSAALMIVVFMVAAPAAEAGTEHAPPWRWTTVHNTQSSIAVGAQQDITLSCPSGYEPVSWSWDTSYGSTASTLTLQAETLDYGSTSGTLRFYNGTNHTDSVNAVLNCANAADLGPVSTKSTVVAHTIGNTGGFLQCNLGTTMIGGSASWDVTGASTRIDLTAPTSSGWYVTGSAAAWTGNLTIQVHCVPSAIASGMNIVQASTVGDANGDGLESVNVDCASNERVANAGAYERPQNESVSATKTLGALRSISQYALLTSKTASVRATMPNTTTVLVVNAICVATSTPTVTITDGPSGLRASADISFTFTATDPAGYQLTYSCQLLQQVGLFQYDVYRQVPCVGDTSNSATAIADGTYLLAVTATNGDGKSDADSRAFTVDATGPIVTVDGKPTDPTTSTAASFTVTTSDAHPGTTDCHLDAQPEQACPSPAEFSGLADGVHTFQWLAVDSLGNRTDGSYSWRVDTVAPAAALTAPVAPFTTATATSVKWTGSDAGSGIASWQVQWQRARYDGGFGAWSSPASFAAGTLSHAYSGLGAGYDYCYRVRAVDAAGNGSAYPPRRCTSVVLDERALTASSGWLINTASAYYGGSALSTKHLNATLQRTGAQLDRLAVLATKCATCGVVGVYVNRTLVAKVNLHSASTHNRQLVNLARFSYRTGTVTLKVLTSGKLVRIDGVGISRT